MENTVTISIDRFKELESIEELFHLMNKGSEVKVKVYWPYNSKYQIYNIEEKTEVLINEYNREIEALKNTLEKLNSEKIEHNTLKSKYEHALNEIKQIKTPWYKRLFKSIQN